MTIPKLDLGECGLAWLLDPAQAQEATGYQWSNYLAVLSHYRALLTAMMADAVNNEDEETAKRCNVLLRHTKDSMSGVQSQLRAIGQH
jgi:hypothetical protein